MMSDVDRPARSRGLPYAPATVARAAARPVRRHRTDLVLVALGVLLVLAALGRVQAAPVVDVSNLTTRTGTTLDFLQSSASSAPSPACYAKGNDPDHSFNCALQALQQTGLDASFADGPITLFAPTDTAFRNLAGLVGSGEFRALLRDQERLRTLMQGLMVKGKLTTANLEARASGATGIARLDTLQGGQLTLDFERFPARAGYASVKVGRATSPKWQAWISDHATALDDGVIIPIDMVPGAR